MTDSLRRLLRDVAERRVPKPGDFNTDPRAVRTWVAALPLANFSATARMLVDALRTLNGLRIAPAERFEVLEILRGPVVQLAALVDKQILGASFPLPPQRAELGVVSQEFQNQLALGYRMVLHDFCAPAGHVPMLRGKQVAAAATRALVHAGARLHKAYLLYRTPSTGAWQQLHDTYRFIASVNLETRMVDDAVAGAATCARTAYVHALLLALANPYRHSQRELMDAIALTGIFAGQCELETAPVQGRLSHVVDTNSDHGPGYLPEERNEATAGVLYLDISALLNHIEGQVSRLPPGIRLVSFRLRGGSPVQVDIDLAQRLVDGWTSDGTRSDARLTGGYSLSSVIGLHDLHYVLAGNEDFESFLRRIRGAMIQLSDQDSNASWGRNAADPMRTQPIRMTVVDQSFGGYRAFWDRGNPGETVRVKVGELVGMAMSDADGQANDWMVGVIRWMRIDDDGRVHAGINLMARRSMAIGVNAVSADGMSQRDHRGILLSPMRSEEAAIYSSMLTPGLFERDAHALRLTLPADAHRWPSSACSLSVAGAGLMESAGAYLRFALPPLELPEELPLSESGVEPDPMEQV